MGNGLCYNILLWGHMDMGSTHINYNHLFTWVRCVCVWKRGSERVAVLFCKLYDCFEYEYDFAVYVVLSRSCNLSLNYTFFTVFFNSAIHFMIACQTIAPRPDLSLPETLFISGSTTVSIQTNEGVESLVDNNKYPEYMHT